MSDLDDLRKYLDRKGEEDRAFQRSLVERNRPKTEMEANAENARLISAGHGQEAEKRKVAREAKEAEKREDGAA
jgi:hypothetical protein